MSRQELTYLSQIHEILSQYDIDTKHGFMPATPPLRSLPPEFAVWESLAADFSGLLNAGQFRTKAENMPVLDTSHLEGRAELERAMLLLSCFGHGYVWEDYQGTSFIPEGIAIPWVEVANRLGRPPVVAHASLVMNNWQFIDSEGPLIADNLMTLMQFHGGQDEAWFYLLTAAMEFRGGELAQNAVLLHLASKNQDEETMKEALIRLTKLIIELRKLLARMPERCDPYIFYNRVRPFLSSLTQVTYQGVEEEPIRSYDGGSAAQSSMIQVLDAVLGVKHEVSHTAAFLHKMRTHMPPQHASFIVFLEKENPISDFFAKNPEIKTAHQACLGQLAAFRTDHLKIVSQYILKQSGKVGPGSTGTGGTNPLIFLKQAQEDTLNSRT